MSIRILNAHFGYSKDQLTLSGLDLNIDEGGFVLIAGANGAGKSTFLKLLNGILKPRSGSISINEFDTRVTPTSVLASHIAVTFQNPADQIFSATVRDEVLFGPRLLQRPNPMQLADASIELLGLRHYSSKHPYDLSPAQRRLLTIASAVATDTPILAFDEPTTSLSQPERLVLLNALRELKHRRRTLIIVSHDLEFFVREATELLVMYEGKIVHRGQPQDIVDNPKLAKSAGIGIPISLRIQKIAAITTRNEKSV